MMASGAKVRGGFWSGALLLVTACTIGPRTPIEDPAASPDEEEEQSLVDAEREDEGDFRLPKAQRVSDEGVEETTPTESHEAGVTVGLATISVGIRPPWAELEALKAPKREENLPTRWRQERTIWVGQGYLHHAAFVPGEDGVVTLSNQSGQIYHYDLAGKLVKQSPLDGFREFDDAAFTPLVELEEPPQLFVTRPEGTGVLDLSSGKFDALERTPPGTDIQHSGRPGLYGVSFRTTTPQSGSLMLKWISGEIALEVACKHRPDGWALSSDGRYLAISYYPADHVEIIDLQEEKLVSTLKQPQWGSAIAISPDDKWIALGGEKLQVASFPDGHVVAEDDKYENNIDTIRFTPSGDLLLTSAYDGKARSYVFPKDLAEKKALPRPQDLNHNGQANVYALGLTRDGRGLVTSSGDKTLKIWRR